MPRLLPQVETTVEACRRFMRLASRLDGQTMSVADAIRHHGYIQMDPIDVCGRMHDLILRNRVRDYRRDGILEETYGRRPREFFEHYIPDRGILVMLPVEDYRFLASTMKARRTGEGYGGGMDADQKRMAAKILKRIRDEGPLSSAAFADSRGSTTGWGTSGTLAKTTLDKLFFHGKLLITRRDSFRRIYDLPERVLPAEILEARPATPRELARWRGMERLRQRRLALLTAAQRLLMKDGVAEVRCDGLPALFCLREDLELLRSAADWEPPKEIPLLLAPLDPLIYDRTVTSSVWNFDYTWEVYTPPAKRVRGYYALPILAGTRIVGHADPKMDRKSGTLHVRVSVHRKVDLSAALEKLSDFLGAKRVQVAASQSGRNN